MYYIYKTFILFLIFLSIPVLIVICVILMLTSGFPIIFFQRRTGKYGKEFTMFKFRTMIPNAEKQQSSLQKLNQADGPVFKIKHDPRLTSFGKFLNHTGLDELPQLFNVLYGNMALIGPRPLPVEEAKKLNHWQKERENSLPGIISPWVLEGYHRTTFNEWMKSDIKYSRNKSFITDLFLFIRFTYYWVSLIARETVRTV